MPKPAITKFAICKAVTDAQITLIRRSNDKAHSDPEYKSGLVEGVMMMYEYIMETLNGLEDPPREEDKKDG